jgi:hypothetical protein
MLADAGYADVQSFRGNGKPSQPDDRLFIVSATRPPDRRRRRGTRNRRIAGA